MNPLLKWAGGKHKLAPQIIDILGRNFNNYFEPFVGGGSVLFELLPEHARCYDINAHLINFYNIVRDDPERLLWNLEKYFIPQHLRRGDDFYYSVRDWDRSPHMRQISLARQAARFLYLNKTCFNGLWRENQFGQNNVPSGHYKNAPVPSRDQILTMSNYLRSHDIRFENRDYLQVEIFARRGDMVYFDPPYDKEVGQNGFVQYSACGFDRNNQWQLMKLCNRLVLDGITVGISNSNTEFIRSLYNNTIVHYEIHEISATRSLGSHPDSRKQINELLIIGKP